MKERFYQFARRYYGVFLFALPIATLAFVFREAFFEGRIFLFSDVINNYLPYFFSESQSSALINQSIVAGFPTLVSLSAAWFDPVRQLFSHFFDAVDTYRILVLSYLLIAYVATYFFARRVGMRLEAAALVGMIYIFAGQMMLWSQAISIAVYYAILPVALLLVDYQMRAQKAFLKKIACSLIIGVILGFGWLSGHVDFLVYIYLTVAAYWLYLALRARLQVKALALEAVWFGIVLLVSAAVGFPQIWAVLNFLPVTVRSLMPLSAMYAYSYYPQNLIQYLIPSFSIPYLALFPRAFHNYIGIIPFIITLFGLFHYKRFKQVPHLAFFAGVFLFCLLTAIQYSPIAALMHYLPVFREFREVVRIMFIGDFALAICIGLVIQHLWQERASGVHESPLFYLVLKRLFLWLFVPMVALFTIFKLFFIARFERLADAYFLARRYQHTTGGLPLEHYFSLIHMWLEQVITQFSLLNPEILSIIVFGILGYVLLHTLGRQKIPVFWAALLCAVSLNFAVVYAGYIHGMPKQELLTDPSTATFIKSQEASSTAPFRIFSPLFGMPFYNDAVRCNFQNVGDWNMDEQTTLLHKELLDPNMFLYYGLDSLDGYEPYMTAKMSNLTSYLGSPNVSLIDQYGIGAQLNTFDDKMAQLLARKNVYSAFNVKYLIALAPLNYPGVKEVYTTSAGTSCKSPVYVYSLGNPWPRYFLTNTVATASPDTPFLTWMDALDKAPRPTVILQEKSLLQRPETLMVPVTPRLADNGMSFTTTTNQDTYLFIGNAWLPGYRASVDGADTRILEVNYTMMAVFVPAGTHTVELRYTAIPPTFLTFFGR